VSAPHGDDSLTVTSARGGEVSVVAGRYEVRARLGRGGHKEVYLAYDVRLDREVAIATVAGGSDSAAARSRVEREARVTGRLGDHPNVITVYDTGEHEGVPYLVLRAMAGGSLADAIARRDLTIADALRLAREIAAALAHAHALGVVHRDVKPDNVWLAADGTAALGDFGIATRLDTERVTEKGVVVGTVRYLSPEQIRGSPGGPSSDLYSLGVTLYELVCGQPPFTASDPELVLAQHLTVAPVPPSEHDATVPLPLERLILELLAKDPAQRPASASLVEQELAVMQNGSRHHRQVVCPFKGLASFEVADAAYFCGREQLIAQLVARLVGPSLLGVIGPSGSGKSSVVRAGLLPALAEGVLPGSEDWAQVLIRPGRHPLGELTGALDRVGDERAVIVVDQFEEAFTTCADEDERRAFVDTLVAATIDRTPRCTVLLVLRADFYGHCAGYPELATKLSANHVLVGAMRDDELRQAIEDPAKRAGLRVDGELTDALVRDVAGQPGGLPLLSTALLELWQQRENGTLTRVVYDRTGGVRGAVSRLAEGTFGRLDDAQQRIARNVLTRLVDEGAAGGVERRRVDAAELDLLGDEARRVVALLTDGRLLSAVSGTVELAHEALLREWPRLQDWIVEDRDGLRSQRNISAAAQEWLRLGRDDGVLYRGGRLAEALAWQAASRPELNELELEFLAAGNAHRRRDAVTRRRHLALAFSSATIVLVAISLAIMGSISHRRESALQRDIAASHDLAERAAGLLDTDPGRSRMVALAAYERYDTDQAESAVRQAALEDRATAILPAHAGGAWGMTVSRDGRLAAAAGASGLVRIFDLRRRALISTIRGHRGAALNVAFSPDGTRVATGGEDGVVAIADVDGGNRRELLKIPRVIPKRGNGGANGVEFSPDGRSLVVGGRDGTVRLIDVDRATSRVLGRQHDEVQRVHFDRAGTKVVSAAFSAGAKIWDVASGRSVRLARAGVINDAVFSPDGDRVAAVDGGGYLSISSARTGRTIVARRFDPSGLLSVRYSRDGRQLVTAGNDGIVRVLDARLVVVLQEIKGHRPGVADAAFASGATIVSSGGSDGDVRIWEPSRTLALPGDPATPEVSADRRYVLWRSRDGALHRWDLVRAEDRVLRVPKIELDGRTVTRASADGSTIVSVRVPFGIVRRYDVRSGRVRRVPTDGTQTRDVALDRTGRRIAISTDGRVTIHDAGRPNVVVPVGTNEVFALAFSPDGHHLAASFDDGSVGVLDTTSGKRERTLRGHDGLATVAFSADGRRIVTAGGDGTIRIWPVGEGEPTILYGHKGAVVSAQLNARGDRIVSAGADGTIRVWDAIGAKQLVVLKRYKGGAGGAAFSADGQRVISAGFDSRRPWTGHLEVSSCEVCGAMTGVLRVARARADRPLSASNRTALGLPEASQARR
jgi:WD40 repeat protein